MSRWLRDGGRILLVAGLVSATTGYVWVKVQISEAAMGLAQARSTAEGLREEHARLLAAVDMAQRPGIVRLRAGRELSMVDPGARSVADLQVRPVLR